VRWHIVGLLLLVATLQIFGSYQHRKEIGRIVSAFVLGYALFQFPAGVLADRYGSKQMLAFSLLSGTWWFYHSSRDSDHCSPMRLANGILDYRCIDPSSKRTPFAGGK